MARIRTIKPEFFRHGGLYDAEVETGLPLRVAFAGLWTACDREGRFQWKPRELKLDALPHDNVDFARVLDALLTRGHVVKYRVNGADFGFIPSWNDHQAINNREAESILPAPDESSIESASCTRQRRVNHAAYAGSSGREGKGREGKGRRAVAHARRLPPNVPRRRRASDLERLAEAAQGEEGTGHRDRDRNRDSRSPKGRHHDRGLPADLVPPRFAGPAGRLAQAAGGAGRCQVANLPRARRRRRRRARRRNDRRNPRRSPSGETHH